MGLFFVNSLKNGVRFENSNKTTQAFRQDLMERARKESKFVGLPMYRIIFCLVVFMK
eukprot:NODE_4834_length_623_cov_83.979094_g4161_i0.p3 GENE.NODE_4834_length_623_cov_83.979094_g4161_i0~~NODE_4834_length_623_cov_83.979094_g4161_i0.p3  ORF type:complete len:57 (+),score=4.67 NODE_4834_length_623_cov_83.979094_g4161_i0:252-422(+)